MYNVHSYFFLSMFVYGMTGLDCLLLRRTLMFGKVDNLTVMSRVGLFGGGGARWHCAAEVRASIIHDKSLAHLLRCTLGRCLYSINYSHGCRVPTFSMTVLFFFFILCVGIFLNEFVKIHST